MRDQWLANDGKTQYVPLDRVTTIYVASPESTGRTAWEICAETRDGFVLTLWTAPMTFAGNVPEVAKVKLDEFMRRLVEE